MSTLAVGSYVKKVGGDYAATGFIRAAFYASNGCMRYVFEFDEPRGLLQIFDQSQLVQVAPYVAPPEIWE